MKNVTRKDYKCVAYRVWWGNLSECVHFIAIFPGNIIISEHTNVETYLFIYTYVYVGHSGRTFWGVGLWPLLCWDRWFETHQGHGRLSVVCVVCCQVELSATRRSLVQRSPTGSGASFLWSTNLKNGPRWAAAPQELIYIYIYICVWKCICI